MDWSGPRQSGGALEGEVVYIDRFGNAITNITGKFLAELKSSSLWIFEKHKRLCPVKDFYQAVPSCKPVGVIGSSGFLEIAVNGGSAAQEFGLKIGDAVELRAK